MPIRAPTVFAACVRSARVAIGDPDVTFGYATSSKVIIRDKRLGFLYYFLTLCILIWIGVYQLRYLQQYRKEAGVIATARTQLQAPSNRTLAPAFCLGVNASTPPSDASSYVFPEPGLYTYTGASGDGLKSPQGGCTYLDARFAVSDPLENGALLLPTRVSIIEEVASPLPACAQLGQSTCTFSVLQTSLTYVPDAEWFTLLVDHSFSALLGSMSKSSSQMEGSMVDTQGRTIDPCDAYTSRGRVCPDFVAVGRAGSPDIFPLQSLLDAVGLRSLDEVGGERGGRSNETLRFSGLILLLSISYSNYFLPATFGGSTLLGTNSFEPSLAKYSYRVSV